jgi:CRISPR-associated protein Cas8a1/Csx13
MQSRNFGTDDAPLVLRYPAFTWLAHQRAAPNQQNEVKGWLMPGASQRHSGHAGTCLAEPLSRFLCLLFLPVGAVYFRVKQKHVRPKDKRKPQTGVPRYALVAPEFNRLDAYARLRGSFYRSGVAELTVSGTAEAAWRVAALAHLEGLVREDLGVFRCRAYAFGNSPGTRQVTRIGLVVVQNPDSAGLRVYSMARQFFPGQWRKAQDGTSYWVAPQIPELVAENLTVHQPWWAGFADFMADRVRRDWILGIVRDGRGRLIKIVKGEKGGLGDMATQQLVSAPERTFVEACHAAWRRRMAQIGDKARREGSSFHDQVQREYLRLYTLFTRCKNAGTLREAVTAFWARGGGPLAPLQDGWHDVLALMDERNWPKAKDLALLALASYKAASKDEAEALETEGTSNEEETQG